MLVWLSVWSEVQLVYIWSSWWYCHTRTPSSLALFKSRLILRFWYRLTPVALEKRPLNGCSSSRSRSISKCFGSLFQYIQNISWHSSDEQISKQILTQIFPEMYLSHLSNFFLVDSAQTSTDWRLQCITAAADTDRLKSYRDADWWLLCDAPSAPRRRLSRNDSVTDSALLTIVRV